MNQRNHQPLIDALMSGEAGPLSDEDITALLSWLSGSTRKPAARALAEELGEAGDQPEVTERAYRLLDARLFFQGQLDADIAGVDSDRSNSARRRRFRLLLSAFHPDRHEPMADWLTERSQTLTLAYAAFKRGDETPKEVTDKGSHSAPKKGTGPKYEGIAQKWHQKLSGSIRERISVDRFLGHKIIGALAAILSLVMISVLLSDSPQYPASTSLQTSPTSADSQRGGSSAERNPSPDLSVSAEATKANLEQSPKALVDGAIVNPDEKALTAAAPTDPSNMIETTSEAGFSDPSRAQAESAAREAEAVDLDAREGNRIAMTRAEITDTPVNPSIDRRADASIANTANPLPTSVEGSRPAIPEPAPTVRREIRPGEALGRLELGPLQRHQVAELLRSYQLAVEASNPIALIELFHEDFRGQVDLDELVHLGAAHQRALSISIINSRTDGDLWRLEVLHRLESIDGDRRLALAPRRAIFRLSRQGAGFRIEDIRFDGDNGQTANR